MQRPHPYVRWTPVAVLAALLILGAGGAGCAGCGGPDDDDSTEVPDGPQQAPPVAVTTPRAGDVLAGGARVRALPLEDGVAAIEVLLGESLVGQDSDPSDGLSLRFRVSDSAANGESELTVRALDSSGALLGAVGVPVRVVQDPPESAFLDASGGALRSPAGVVVVVPPGALADQVGMEVVDLDIAALPADAMEEGVEPYLAIDLRPADPADADLVFGRPLALQFPHEGGERDAGDLIVAAVGEDVDEDGDADLELVGQAETDGTTAWTADPDGPVILAISNLTLPGEPLHPGDLLQITGDGFPNLPGDLLIRVNGEDHTDKGMVREGGTRIVMMVPPRLDDDASALAIDLVNRWTGEEASVELAVEPRPEPRPDVGEADRRIAVLFGTYITWVEYLLSPDAPTALQDLVDRLGRDLVEEWRDEIDEFAGEVFSDSEDGRIELGHYLAPLERNIQILSDGAARGEDDVCFRLRLLYQAGNILSAGADLVGLFGWWWTPATITGSAIAKFVAINVITTVVGGMVDNQCEPPEDGRGGGPRKFECDILGRIGLARGGAPGLARLEGNVYAIYEQQVDEREFRSLRPAFGVGINPIDTDVMPWGAASAQRGATRLLATAGLDDLEVRLHPPGGESFVVGAVKTPRTVDDLGYALLFVQQAGLLDGDVPLLENAFDLEQGVDAGLPLDLQGRSIATGDLDGDGNVDHIVQTSAIDTTSQGIFLEYVAWGRADGTFDALPLGPFPLSQWSRVNGHGVGQVVDLDGDGDLDVMLTRRPDAPSAVNLNALLNHGSRAFEAVTLAALDEAGCEAAGAVAVGDFVPGGGPDLLTIAANTPQGDDGSSVDGAVCLLAHLEGPGLYYDQEADDDNDPLTLPYDARIAPRTGRGLVGHGAGAVADLDGDGNLDAFFDTLGSVFFGDGEGGFDEVVLPEACWSPYLAVENMDRPAPPPVLLDYDRDGWLDLVTRGVPQVAWPDEPLRVCVLLNDGARGFSEPAVDPLFDVPFPEDGPFARATTIAAADLDADGQEDLVIADGDFNPWLFVGFRRGDVWVEPPALAGFQFLSWVAPTDVEPDGDIDLLLATDWFEPDVLLRNRIDGGGLLTVDVRGAGGAATASGASITVDLDGGADFSPGPALVTRAATGAPELIGLGDATQVDVRVVYLDTGAPGGNVVVQTGVTPGSALTIQDPQ